MMLVMLMLYLMVEIVRHRASKYNVIRYVVVAFLLVVIMFTNSLMALISMALLGLFWVSFLVYDKFIREKIYVLNLSYNPLIIVACVYLVVVLAWWTFGTGQSGIILRMIGWEDLAKLIAPYMPYGDLLLERGLYRDWET